MQLEPYPHARLAAGACGAVAAMGARSLPGLVPVGILVAAGAVVTATPWSAFARLWWRFSLLLGIAFVGGAAGAGPDGTTIPLVGVVVTGRGVTRGLFLAARVAMAAASVRALLWMTDPQAVRRAVTWWLSPLKLLGVDSERAGEALGLTMAVLPCMSRELWSSLRRAGLRPARWADAVAEVVKRTTEEGLGLRQDQGQGPLPAYSRRASVLVAGLGVVALIAAIACR